MIGKTLAHYEVVSALGKGGMGEVWRRVIKSWGVKSASRPCQKNLVSEPAGAGELPWAAKVSDDYCAKDRSTQFP